MKSNQINQLKMGALLSYLQMILQCIVSLVYTPIMIQALGDSEYGVYSLAISVTSYLSLLNFGFGSAYIRYYSKYKSINDIEKIQQLNGMFLSIFIIFGVIVLIIGGILLLGIKCFFARSMNEQEVQLIRILMMFMIVNMAISFLDSVFTSFVTAHEKFIFQKVLNMLKTVATPISVIVVLKVGGKSIPVVMVTTVYVVIAAIINVIYCKKKLHIHFSFGKFDFELLKEMASFSLFIAVNNLIDQINWNVDKVILGKVKGAVAVAIYSTASQINSLVMQISTSISNVFVPRVNRLVVEKKREELLELFIKVGRIQFIFLSLVISGYIFFGKYFIQNIYAKESYVEAYYIGLFLIIPALIPLVQNLGIEIQRAMYVHKFRAYIYLFMAIINILISIPLANAYSGIGCAIGTAVSLLVANGVLMNWYYYKKMKIDIFKFWKEIFSIFSGLIVPGIVGVFINLFVEYYNVWMYFGTIVFYGCVFACSIWKYGLNNFEKNLFLGIYLRMRGVKK